MEDSSRRPNGYPVELAGAEKSTNGQAFSRRDTCGSTLKVGDCVRIVSILNANDKLHQFFVFLSEKHHSHHFHILALSTKL